MDRILAYLERKEWAFNFYSLNYLREQELQLTPLYRLVLRSSIRLFVMTPSQYERGETNDIEFLHDKPQLMMEVLGGVRDFHKLPHDQVWLCDTCEYHEHVDGVRCG